MVKEEQIVYKNVSFIYIVKTENDIPCRMFALFSTFLRLFTNALRHFTPQKMEVWLKCKKKKIQLKYRIN